MKHHFLILSLLVSSIISADCVYEAKTPKVTWKAFKTYEKIGVGGSFDKSSFTSSSQDSSLDALLTKSSIIIDTSSINSGNSGRDATLVELFFKVQNIETIGAKIQSAKEGKAIVDITMNGITKSIPLAYTTNKGKIVAKGVIDLADFGMIPSLSSINKACFKLHDGKTWQDIEIGFEMPLNEVCK